MRESIWVLFRLQKIYIQPKNLHTAKKFAGSTGAVCVLNIQPNIPYVDINTWNNSEAEIILPRGLTYTVKSKNITKKSKQYVIDVSLTANS
jgi:hypothetical protein